MCPATPVSSKTQQRETWKPNGVYLVGGQTRSCADQLVISEVDLRELNISVGLAFIGDRSQQLGHSVGHALNACVNRLDGRGLWRVCAH